MLITCPFPVSRLLLVSTESHHFLLNRWMAQTLTRKMIRCLLVHPLSCFCEASQLATVSTRAHQDGTQVFVILVANVFCKVSQYFHFSCVRRAGPLVAISLSTNPSTHFFCRCGWGLSSHCMYYVFIFLFHVAVQDGPDLLEWMVTSTFRIQMWMLQWVGAISMYFPTYYPFSIHKKCSFWIRQLRHTIDKLHLKNSYSRSEF